MGNHSKPAAAFNIRNLASAYKHHPLGTSKTLVCSKVFSNIPSDEMVKVTPSGITWWNRTRMSALATFHVAPLPFQRPVRLYSNGAGSNIVSFAYVVSTTK